VAAAPRKGPLTPSALEASLAGGAALPLYILEGDRKAGTDRIAIERCLAMVRAKVVGTDRGAESDWNLTILTRDRLEIAEMLDAAATMPLFSGQRLVVVRGVSELLQPQDEGGQKEQIARLAGLSAERGSSVLVLVEPPLDGRLRVHKALVEAACIVTCPSPTAEEMPGWLAGEAKARGLSLARDAAETLAAITGTETMRARQEIEKLSLYLGAEGRAKPIPVAEVAAVAAGGAVADAWRMCDAIARLEEAEALRLARELLEAGEEEVALLGAIAFRVRQMLLAAEALARRVPPRDIPALVRAWGSTRTVLEKNVARYEAGGLVQSLRDLTWADSAIKKGADGHETMLSLVSRIIRAAGEPRAGPRCGLARGVVRG